MAIEIKNSEAALKNNIEEQERREEMLHFLNKASEELSKTLDNTIAYDTIAHLIVTKLADWFSIEVLNEEGKFDLLVMAHKDLEQVKWGLELRDEYPTDMNAPTGTP